jgi:hypothetical protein
MAMFRFRSTTGGLWILTGLFCAFGRVFRWGTLGTNNTSSLLPEMFQQPAFW